MQPAERYLARHKLTSDQLNQLNELVAGRPKEYVPISAIRYMSRSTRDGFKPKNTYPYVRPATPVLLDKENHLLDGKHRVARTSDTGSNEIAAIRVTDADLKKVANRYLTKHAELLGNVHLRPHQEEARDSITDPGADAQLYMHGLGTGKCVRGDTPVLTDWGLLNIEDLFNSHRDDKRAELLLSGGGLRVAARRGTAIEWVPVRHRYRQKLAEAEQTYVVATNRGSYVEVTKIHPMLSVRNGKLTWVAVQNLRVGDWLATAGSVPGDSWTAPEDIAVLLAWQVAEGYENANDGTTTITQNNLAVLTELQARFKRLMPESNSGYLRKLETSSPFLEITSVGYRRLLEGLGYIWGMKSANKKLPARFLGLPLATIRAVLRSLFDGEGHAGKCNIELTLASKALLLQIQYLLLRFGIRSSIHDKVGRATNGKGISRIYYRLSISGEDLEIYSRVLGFGYSYKQVATDSAATRKRNPNFGIPVGFITDKLTELGLIKTFGLAHARKKSCSRDTCIHLAHELRYRSSIEGRLAYAAKRSRHTKRVLSTLETESQQLCVYADAIQELVDCPFRFEVVTAVTPARRGGWVYDLEIDNDNYDDKHYVAGVGGLIVHNTLSSIAGVEGLNSQANVVVPASLRNNYKKDVNRFVKDPTFGPAGKYNVISYDRAAKGGVDPRQVMVADEVQRVRNQGRQYQGLLELAKNADKRILLSGTPLVNSTSDMASIVNLLHGKQLFTPEEFDKRFISQKVHHPLFGFIGRGGLRTKIRHQGQLEDLLRGKVHYVGDMADTKPAVQEDEVTVPMSKKQDRLYRSMSEKLPFWLRWQIKHNLPITKQDSPNLNAFRSGMRQISLSPNGFDRRLDPLAAFNQSPKLMRALEDIKAEMGRGGKVMSYSNFVNAGLNPLAAALEANKIPYTQFHGGMSDAARKKAVEDYNKGRARVSLIGPAGSEGISLKETSMAQLLDPHWNEARTNQAQGRAIRMDSHTGLPPELRNVRVRRYLSEPRPGWVKRLLGMKGPVGSDLYLHTRAKEKQEQLDVLNRMLQEIGTHG